LFCETGGIQASAVDDDFDSSFSYHVDAFLEAGPCCINVTWVLTGFICLCIFRQIHFCIQSQFDSAMIGKIVGLLTSQVVTSDEIYVTSCCLTEHLPAWITYAGILSAKSQLLIHFKGDSPAYPEQFATFTGLLPISFVLLAFTVPPTCSVFFDGAMFDQESQPV
jgi:hypothetical protein